jgi:chromosomal replication initiation ATPase DnaA
MASLRQTQIPLDLTPAPDFTFARFIEAPSNSGALAVVKAWPAWPAPAILLIGPEGTGKTHLGEAWQADTDGIFLDDADGRDEDVLFATINRALRGEIPGLLLASRTAPEQWGLSVPDLKSRLAAMPKIELFEPDDDSLMPITKALFERRGRDVSRDVVDYLLRYTERSVGALQTTIRQIDEAALSAKVDVTKAFAAKIVRENLELFDEGAA